MGTTSNSLQDVADLDTFYGITQMDHLSIWFADADWCSACPRLRERYRELALVYGSAVDFCRVDVDQAQAISQVLNVQALPSTYAFRKAVELDFPWQVGVPMVSMAQYREWINKHSAPAT
ncbi:co-chaperone YbbN [Streptomyces gilvifuscus]|uniref:Thioredoxin domain-containing protein n=1 Tax=Streptomyces gilvifuscus TaxID=1550617 RepID=A0ABT5G3E2_9ACTN|nr:thioredoxin domain-containing protein [Streptomyces gilvifuscus]MDC2959283.1 thioredoxin domain-containing protein [Streptomyces gilvifuscus]